MTNPRNPIRGAPWPLRLAQDDDIAALEELIPLSVRRLQAAHYSPAQMEAALGTVFGVDRQLIRDGTYFVAEHNARIVGCGGWSRRRSMFGADAGRAAEDPELDPRRDAARIRAFFVHPDFARRGIGSSILLASEQAIREARFQRVDIVATLAGEPLYASFGYRAVERFGIPLVSGVEVAEVPEVLAVLELPAVRMTKTLETFINPPRARPGFP